MTMLQPHRAETASPPAAGSLTDQLWLRYRQTGDPGARAALLDGYLGLVHHCAGQMLSRLPANVEYDDLVSAGTLGLVQALETFDLGRGVAFSSFAVPRIRGAMLDELRSREWLPKNARTRKRLLLAARDRLLQRLNREPTTAEMAEELGLDSETYWRWQLDLDQGTAIALESPTRHGDGAGLHEVLPDERIPDPTEPITRREKMERLREVMQALPEKERLVVSLSFLEQLQLKQIGELLHVSESRVSQIRTRALQRMRQALEDLERSA